MLASNVENDMCAAAWARQLGSGDSIFADLAIGDRFRFKASPPGEILIKAAGGYRVQHGSPKVWRTGSRSAVFRLPAENIG